MPLDMCGSADPIRLASFPRSPTLHFSDDATSAPLSRSSQSPCSSPRPSRRLRSPVASGRRRHARPALPRPRHAPRRPPRRPRRDAPANRTLHELTLHVDPLASVSPPSGHRIGANLPSPHSSNPPRAIQVSSGPLRLASFPRLRARHLRDAIIGARHPPGDLGILVLLRALLIPQGAPAALHTPALDVAYVMDDHEPLDAHPALVLAVVSSLYMLYAELAFRSGYAASSYLHIVSHANPAFFPAMPQVVPSTIHAFSAALCTSATPPTRSSAPDTLALCPPAQGALGLRYEHYAPVTAHRCLPCAPVAVF
jgi:hypothetical protein